MSTIQTLLVFICIWGACVAMAFWEAYAEGRNAWDQGKLGWKLRLGRFTFSGYHFFLFIVMWPLLLTLPFIVNGWSRELFGIIVSAWLSGLIIEDVMWYVVNPAVKFRELNTEFASYYPRVTIGTVRVPLFYFVGIILSVASWYFLWK